MKKRHLWKDGFFLAQWWGNKCLAEAAPSPNTLSYGVISSDSSTTGQRLSLGFLHRCCRPGVALIWWTSRFVELVRKSLRPRTCAVELVVRPSAILIDFAELSEVSCSFLPFPSSLPPRRYQLSILKIHLFTLTRRSDEEKEEPLLLLALIQKGDGERGDLSLRIPADRLEERMYPNGSSSISSSVLKELDVWSERDNTIF